MRYNLKKREDLGKKVVVFKPRAVIHSKINRTLAPREQKFFNLALKKAKEVINYYSSIPEYKKIVEEWEKGIFKLLPLITISISELKKIFPVFQHKTKKELYKFISKIEEVKIERINILKKDIEKEIIEIEKITLNNEISDNDFEMVGRIDKNSLISNVTINYTEDYVSFYLPSVIMAYLANPNMYINFNLLVLNYLNKSYSIALYEFLYDFFKNQERKNKKDFYKTGEIPLDKLKEILGISKDKYKIFSDFRKYVLKPAIEELNNSDVVSFFTEPQEIKKGKKVVAINFFIEPKPDYLLNDVILTKKGIKKVSYKEKDIERVNEYPVKKELFDLKERVKSGIPYIIFKRELMKIQDTYICNKIEGYLPHLLLKTDSFGHLELYNPQTDTVRTLDAKKDAKELEELRQMLYQNPEKLGDIQKIDENELFAQELKKETVGKVSFRKNSEGLYIAVLIKDVQIKDDKFIFIGDDLIEGYKNIKIIVKKENLEAEKQRLYNNFDNSKIEEYQLINRNIKYENMTNEFERFFTKKDIEKIIEKIESEAMKLTDEWTEAEKEGDNDKMEKTGRRLEFLDKITMELIEYINKDKTPSFETVKYVLENYKKE